MYDVTIAGQGREYLVPLGDADALAATLARRYPGERWQVTVFRAREVRRWDEPPGFDADEGETGRLLDRWRRERRAELVNDKGLVALVEVSA